MSREGIDIGILSALEGLIGENYLLIDPSDMKLVEDVGTIRFGRPGKYLMPLTKEYIKTHLIRIRHMYKESAFLDMYSLNKKELEELCNRG